MGFVDDKLKTSNLINQFDLLGSLPEGKVTSSLESVNSKDNNLLPFLLDMIKQAGKDGKPNLKSFVKSATSRGTFNTSGFSGPVTNKDKIKEVLIDILNESLPKISEVVKEGIVKAIKKSFSCDNTVKINAKPVVITKVNTIDLDGMLKIDPDSEAGQLYYGDNESEDINLFIYNAIQTPNTKKNWKNLFDVTYLDSSDDIKIEMNDSFNGKLFVSFMEDYMNSISIFGTKKTNLKDKVNYIINTTMDNLYGTLSSSANISLETISAKEEVRNSMDKIFNTDPCELGNNLVTDDFFQPTKEELSTVLDKAKNKFNGFQTVDLSLGPSDLPYFTSGSQLSLPISNLSEISSNILSSKTSNLKQTISNSIDNITNSLNPGNIIDADAFKTSFSTSFINEIPKTLAGVIFTPKILVLYQMVNQVFTGQAMTSNTSKQFTLDHKVFFEYVVRESLAVILEILYDRLKSLLLNIISSFGAKFVKDQANLKIKSILSIVYGKTEGLLNSIPTPNISEK
jgi:hypothetical protein